MCLQPCAVPCATCLPAAAASWKRPLVLGSMMAEETSPVAVAAGDSYTSIAEVLADFNSQWDNMVSTTGHPIDFIRKSLCDVAAKKAFAKLIFEQLKHANPDFGSTILHTVNKADAMNVKIGCPGEAHVLQLGFDKVGGDGRGGFGLVGTDNNNNNSCFIKFSTGPGHTVVLLLAWVPGGSEDQGVADGISHA